jgi:SAM-dependent methyltransferase
VFDRSSIVTRPPREDALIRHRNSVNLDRQALARRANELYHDLQAGEFNDVHRNRHAAECRFWRDDVLPTLRHEGASFGVDLCTGTGFVPGILLSALPSVTVLCVDLSARAVEQAEVALRDYAGRAKFHAGDVCDLPLRDGSADWLSMNAALHHIPQPDRVYREIDRVLRPGGRFCLGHEPNAAFFNSAVVSRLERAIWNGFWYLSPQRNWRRMSRQLGRSGAASHDLEYLAAINRLLLAEDAIAGPLTLRDLRALVDVHADGGGHARDERGFSLPDILQRQFAGYGVEMQRFSDYGGEMLRPHPRLRVAYDGVMRRLAPGKGQLFSCILCKPETPAG